MLGNFCGDEEIYGFSRVRIIDAIRADLEKKIDEAFERAQKPSRDLATAVFNRGCLEGLRRALGIVKHYDDADSRPTPQRD